MSLSVSYTIDSRHDYCISKARARGVGYFGVRIILHSQFTHLSHFYSSNKLAIILKRLIFTRVNYLN